MRDKTDFQRKCSEQFLNSLQKNGVTCDKWNFIDGEKESYFQGEAGSVSVWIYEDGACIKKNKESKMFEELDYNTEDELIKNFIDNFIKLNIGDSVS